MGHYLINTFRKDMRRARNKMKMRNIHTPTKKGLFKILLLLLSMKQTRVPTFPIRHYVKEITWSKRNLLVSLSPATASLSLFSDSLSLSYAVLIVCVWCYSVNIWICHLGGHSYHQFVVVVVVVAMLLWHVLVMEDFPASSSLPPCLELLDPWVDTDLFVVAFGAVACLFFFFWFAWFLVLGFVCSLLIWAPGWR